MKLSKLLKLLSKVRQIINPPYSKKDLMVILGVLIVLAAIPFTVILSLQRPSTIPRAAVIDITMANYNAGTWSTVNPSPGQSVTANVEVMNYGDTSLPSSIVRFYPFKSYGVQGPVCNEASSYSKSVPALSPGQIYTVSFTFNAPSTQGIYSAWAFVDATCVINEGVEEINNSSAVSYVVGPITANVRADGSDGPITISYNSSAMLTWSSTNSLGCSASGDWSGGKPTSGSESTGSLTSNRTYTILCGVSGVGFSSDSVIVNVLPPSSSSCTNQCLSGTKQCVNNTSYQTCGDFNGDGCTEWSSAKSCPAGQTCSGSGICGSLGDSGGTTGGNKPAGVTKSSGGTGSGKLENLTLEISVPYLVGTLKAKVEIGSFQKEIEINNNNKQYSLDVKDSSITLNKAQTVTLRSDKTLIRKVTFTPTAIQTTVNLGDLILGDINQDNIIDTTDQTSLVNSIASQTLQGDLNLDTVANSMDWSILLTNFGKKGD